MKAWWSYEYYRNLNKKKCNAIYFDDTVHLWINQPIYTDVLLVSVWLFVHLRFVIKLHYWAKFSIVFFNRQFFAFLLVVPLNLYQCLILSLCISLTLCAPLFLCTSFSHTLNNNEFYCLIFSRWFKKKRSLDSFQLKI